MPNRFIFSLRFSTKVFLRLGFMALAFLLFMSLFRMNLYFLSVFHATPDAVFVEIFQSFVAGARFDLLVLGFLFVPLYFLILVQAFSEAWPKAIFWFYKIYFALAWIMICALTFFDFFHFAQFGQRMRFKDYQALNVDMVIEQINRLPQSQGLVFCVIAALLLLLGLMLVKGLQFGNWKDEFSPHPGTKFEVVWRVVLPLILIALAARGTVEAHHLELQHSEVSTIKAINEMALNAVWCFDK